MLRQFFRVRAVFEAGGEAVHRRTGRRSPCRRRQRLRLPVMIAKVFPVVFDNTQIPPEIHDIIARTVAPEHMHVAVLVAVCSLLPLIFAIRGIGSFFNVYWISIVSMKVLEEIRLDAFSRLQTLPLSFIDRQKRRRPHQPPAE